jgi:pimeloyl-ACP methyl ester carboxylesterase
MTDDFPKVDDETLRDLSERLRMYRKALVPSGQGWSRGTDLEYLDELLLYWGNDFDYRAQERRLEQLPWTRVERSVRMRLLHHVVDIDRPTVLLLHGWPDSILRFERVLPLLADVNVVVPCLPAVGLGDSPAGLASWLVEKMRSWTDCGGDVESVFTKDELLTWIMAYWVTGTIGTSFTPYVSDDGRPWGRVQAPTVFTVFPKDLVNAPRSFAERFFDVRVWREYERGGHFAAWECPEDYVWGVRQAIELA